MVPHVFSTILCEYTNREDSDRTYESRRSLLIVARMEHAAAPKMVSHWARTIARSPLAGPTGRGGGRGVGEGVMGVGGEVRRPRSQPVAINAQAGS